MNSLRGRMLFGRVTALKIKVFYFLASCHLQACVGKNQVPTVSWPQSHATTGFKIFLTLGREGLFVTLHYSW